MRYVIPRGRLGLATDLVVRFDDDGSSYAIPLDGENADADVYREWVAAGNAPEQEPLPPQNVPASVSLWQAKAALQAAGLLDAANSAVASFGNPAVAAFWQNASVIDRASPTLAALAAALSLDSAHVDALFIAAAAISL